MLTVVAGTVLALHGLTHLWYVVLAQRLVAFQPEMGWSGRSWALTANLGDPLTRAFATATYLLAATTFTLGGASLITHSGWTRPLLAGSAALSLAAIALFWDGATDHLVEKGLIGLAIDVAVLVWVFVS